MSLNGGTKTKYAAINRDSVSLFWLFGGVVANVLNCGILVTEFESQSRFYVYVRTSTFRKRIKPLILPSYGLNRSSAVPL